MLLLGRIWLWQNASHFVTNTWTAVCIQVNSFYVTLSHTQPAVQTVLRCVSCKQIVHDKCRTLLADYKTTSSHILCNINTTASSTANNIKLTSMCVYKGKYKPTIQLMKRTCWWNLCIVCLLLSYCDKLLNLYCDPSATLSVNCQLSVTLQCYHLIYAAVNTNKHTSLTSMAVQFHHSSKAVC